MHVLSSEELAKTAAKRWDRFYFPFNNVSYSRGTNEKHRAISDSLNSLENPTPEEVNKIIGNDSWTTLYDSIYGTKENKVVVLTDLHSHEVMCLGSKSLKELLAIWESLNECG